MVNGSYFGEIEIIFDKKRAYSAYCESDCELYTISRIDFEEIITEEFPTIKDKLKEKALEREKRNALII